TAIRQLLTPKELPGAEQSEPASHESADNRRDRVDERGPSRALFEQPHRLVVEARVRRQTAKEADRDRHANVWRPGERQRRVHDGRDRETPGEIDDEGAVRE